MKTTRLMLLFLAIVGAVACKYDDDALWDKVNSLDERVSSIEQQLSQSNSDILAIKTITDALQNQVYVKSVTETAFGYEILFTDGKKATIMNGKDGQDGENGKDGQDGQDGNTPFIGEDGNWWIGTTNTGVKAAGTAGQNAPVISIKKDGGKYYWVQVVNGVESWLTTDEGAKIPVNGADAVAPLLKVSTMGYWMVSYDGGITYTEMLDEDGYPVKATGKNGSNGSNGDSFFRNVQVMDDQLVLVLANGQILVVDMEPMPLQEYILLDQNLGDDVDFAMLGLDGTGFFYDYQGPNNDIPARLTVYDGTTENVTLTMNFDEEGLPANLITDDYTIVFRIEDRNTGTFAANIIAQDGTSQLLDNLTLGDGLTWEDYLNGLTASTFSRAATAPAYLGWTNFIVNSVSVAITEESSIEGLGTALVTVTNATFVEIMEDLTIFEQDGTATNMTIISQYANISSCTTGPGVASCLQSISATVTIISDSLTDAREDDINLGEGGLISGNGELKVTLTWNNHSDIDLHCVCPDGHHIYFADRTPTGCEGNLDFDNIPGFGPDDPCLPENIYFEAAPAGHYKVYIHYFSERNGVSAVQYRVVIYKNGIGQVHTGTIAHQGTNILIDEFDLGGTASFTLKPGYTIDWENLPAKTAV